MVSVGYDVSASNLSDITHLRKSLEFFYRELLLGAAVLRDKLVRPGPISLPLYEAVLQGLMRSLQAPRRHSAYDAGHSIIVDPCADALPLANDRIGVTWVAKAILSSSM